jgi:hypothetical protein
MPLIPANPLSQLHHGVRQNNKNGLLGLPLQSWANALRNGGKA